MPTKPLPNQAASGQPQLLRFRLRQMFFLVSLLSVLCALMTATTGAWPWVIGITALLVAGHVCGNLIGTRLRDTSLEIRRWKVERLGYDPDQPVAAVGPIELAKLNLPPTTPLANFGRARGWAVWLVLGGTLLGAVAGGSVLALTIGARITWPGLALGTVSCAVLGAWVAFLASSFGTIARHAWRHAQDGAK